MNTASLPPGVQRFIVDEIAPEPWRNGLGITRTVARHPGYGPAQWRISVADIDADAPFSAFPGMERNAVLLRGPGLALRCADGSALRFDALGDRARFAGEATLHAQLGAGPARLWNVMTARTQWTARLALHRGGGKLSAPQDAEGATVLMVLDGEVQAMFDHCAGTVTLLPGAGLILGAGAPGLQLLLLQPGATWLKTAIHPERAPAPASGS